MAQYLDKTGLSTLWGKIKEKDTATLNAANNVATSKVNAAKEEIQENINATNAEVTTVKGYFTNGAANKALADGDGKKIADTYATKEALNNLGSTVNTATTNITSLLGWFNTADGAAKKAVADGSGNNIENTYIKKSEKGKANGVATLGSDGLIPAAQLPSYVDDVVEYDTRSAFPTTGETGKIYVALDSNKQYRWSGTTYTIISESLSLGETAATAYAGDKGKANADAIADLQEAVETNTTDLRKVEDRATDLEDQYDELNDAITNLDAQGIKYSGQGVAATTVDGAIAELAANIESVEEAMPTVTSITEAEINAICV